jgi:hypothetical protein
MTQTVLDKRGAPAGFEPALPAPEVKAIQVSDLC